MRKGKCETEGPALTDMQERFIGEFMIDRNAKQAAIRAGYSTSSATRIGSQTMRVQAVKDEIDRRTKERALCNDLPTDKILKELERIAFFDVRTLFTPEGQVRTNPHEMKEEDARALVNFDICVLDKQGSFIVKLNPGNRLRALELLGRHLGLFTNRVESKSSMTLNFTTDFGDDDVSSEE